MYGGCTDYDDEPPRFSVEIIDRENPDKLFPSFTIGGQRYVVGLPGFAYCIRITWDEFEDIGLCQFRVEVDGQFAGYARVRNVVPHGRDKEVVFDGFMVSKGNGETSLHCIAVLHKGSTDEDYRENEYAEFTFAKKTNPEDAQEINEGQGKILVKIFHFENTGRRHGQKALWGSVASNSASQPGNEDEDKKMASTLTTRPGATFTVREGFARRGGGHAVGPPFELHCLEYDSVANFSMRGLLSSSNALHKAIIDWGTEMIDPIDLGPSQPSANVPYVNGGGLEVIDLTQEVPVTYTTPKPPVCEVCDLTEESAGPVWKPTHKNEQECARPSHAQQRIEKPQYTENTDINYEDDVMDIDDMWDEWYS